MPAAEDLTGDIPLEFKGSSTVVGGAFFWESWGPACRCTSVRIVEDRLDLGGRRVVLVYSLCGCVLPFVSVAYLNTPSAAKRLV